MLKQEGAVSPNQGVFQLKEILIYLSLVCLPRYLSNAIWMMLAEDSRTDALTGETVGFFAGSMWVSEVTSPSLHVVTGLSKKKLSQIFLYQFNSLHVLKVF